MKRVPTSALVVITTVVFVAIGYCAAFLIQL